MTDSSLNCQRCLDLLDDYRRDTLSAVDRGQMVAHLADCPECSEELNFRTGLGNALRSSLPVSAEPLTFLSPAVQESLAAARHKHDRPRKSPLLPWMLTAAVLVVGAIAFVQTSGTSFIEDKQTISLHSQSEMSEQAMPEEKALRLAFDPTSGTTSSGDVFRAEPFQDKESAPAEDMGRLGFDLPAQVASEAAPTRSIAEYDSDAKDSAVAPAAAAPMAGASVGSRVPAAAPMSAMQQQSQEMSTPDDGEFYEQAKAKRELTGSAAPKKDAVAEDRAADKKEFRVARASSAAAVMTTSAQYRLADEVTSAALTSGTLANTTDTLTSSPR